MKESDSSPPPEKSPVSPDSIILQSLSERKKWTQSSVSLNRIPETYECLRILLYEAIQNTT